MKGKFWFSNGRCFSWACQWHADCWPWAAEPEVKYIDAATLKGMLGDPDLVIIDTSQGWWTYDQKIVGSLVFPEEASSWASRLSKDKKIVLYCG